MRVALIGYGSMASKVVEVLRRDRPDVTFVGVLKRSRNSNSEGNDLRFCNELSELIALKPCVIAECATQAAVADYAKTILLEGIPLIVASVGALADTRLHDSLHRVAAKSGAPMIIPAGAVGAIDALAATRFGKIREVIYRGIKPASAWKGSPAEHIVNLDQLTKAQTFFRGTARDAARQYPKNSNVAATVALAGVGFDDTRVELVADPNNSQNRHEISVDSDSSSFEIKLVGNPSAENPKTSVLSALSVAQTIASLDTTLALQTSI